jgi:hypothetical protein
LVPEEVAQDWLHRHWSHSPFGFLSSNRYQFARVLWDLTKLLDILAWPDEWDPGKTLCHGRHLLTVDFSLGRYMRARRAFPLPIVVLDNRTGALDSDPRRPDTAQFPRSHVVVEGHRRHALACAMQEGTKPLHEAPVWLMRSMSN